jgi:hypothetical protein
MEAAAVPVGQSWMWTLAFEYHDDRTPTHGYAATPEPRWRRREELAAGISGAGQAEQATRQRWPPPAPRLRRLLRCHPCGWQSGRGGLSTGATLGRGDRGEGTTTAISIARTSFRDVAPGPGGRPRLDSERFRSAQRTAGHFCGSLYSQSGGIRLPKIAGAVTGRPGPPCPDDGHGSDDARRGTTSVPHAARRRGGMAARGARAEQYVE